MKKYIIRTSLLAALAVSMHSCVKDEYLNPVALTALSDATAFDNKERIENQVKGLYSGLKAGNLYGGRYFIYNDVRAENFLSNDPNRVTARAAWEFSEGAADNEVNNLWGAAYTTINRANLFLDGMADKGDAVAGADAARWKAEAKFVRAVCYYSLMQFFAMPFPDGNGAKPGIPLRLVGIKGGGFNDLARSTVGEVYAQILKDLNEAEADLPSTNGSAVLNTTRAHKNTAIAMKVRVYMSMAQYPNVITEANKIVSATAPFSAPTGVPHALAPDILTVFNNYTTNESIFSMPFTTNDAPGGQNSFGHYYMPNGVGGAAGIFYLNPAGIVGDPTWTATDKRRQMIIDNGGKQWLSKFDAPGPFLDWAPVLRYSEVLLSLAEAITRNGNAVDPRAVALLNAVRNRSDAATTFAVGDFANATALTDAILKERNIEFLGEGIRSIDILRLLQPFPAKSIPGFTVSAVAPTNPAYIWPTPSEEVRYNKLIQ